MALGLQLLMAAVILVAVWQVTRREIVSASRELAGELRDDLLAAYREGGVANLLTLTQDRLRSRGTQDIVILVIDRSGARIAGNLDAWPNRLPADGRWHRLSVQRSNAALPEDTGVIATALPNHLRLLTGHVIEGELRVTGIVAEAALGTMLLAIFLAALSGVVTARLVSHRVAALATTASAVSAGRLSERVRLDGSGDAFDAVGHAINAMLDRIEGLVDELRLITDALGHDLRSPLTRLKSHLENAMAQEDESLAAAALDKAVAEADLLMKMVSTALEIGRLEAGIGRDRFAETDLAELVRDLGELYGPIAQEQGYGIQMETQGDAVAWVNRELIGQALGNLIDNVLKHATGGTLELAARRLGGRVEVSVRDAGPGIPADRRSEALQRFSRLDPARQAGGAGLGLALVAAVARLHGARLRLEDALPGLRVVLELPVRRSQDE